MLVWWIWRRNEMKKKNETKQRQRYTNLNKVRKKNLLSLSMRQSARCSFVQDARLFIIVTTVL